MLFLLTALSYGDTLDLGGPGFQVGGMSLKVFHVVFVSIAGLFLALFSGWAFLFAPGLDAAPPVALGVSAAAGLVALIVTERRVLASLPRRAR